ncbi:MAG TPA: ATP-binding cassette domain-containing protein [Steroidobacteraceae bacterium]|nr:ATP-binding cassette domain-containing protein [Steroidobacteraceae bacterium]
MNQNDNEQRLHSLDAVRGFALLIGVAFHATLSFMPGWPAGLWAMNDNSPSQFLSDAGFVTHLWRMSLFFFIAGYFGRLLYQKLGPAGFWANRGKRIAVPLVIGWIVVFPMIVAVWTIGVTKATGATPAPPPAGPPGSFPLTHLWFLYQLLITYAAVLGVRSLIARVDPAQRIRNFVGCLMTAGIRSGVAAFTLGIPLAAALFALPMWFYWAGIPTPDQSLIPQVPATVGFGTAFVVGWLVHRASAAALPAMEKRWPVHLTLAVAITAVLMTIMKQHPLAEPGFTKVAYAYLFGVAVWSWVFGITGAALRFLSDYSATRRYIADASYWIYVMHLPVVAAVQVWVGRWPLHWSVKYPFILAVSFAVLFASYHWLVRPSFIGLLLNGRRVRRGDARRNLAATSQPASTQPAASPSAAPALAVDAACPVAELRGVTKRYGKNTALSDIDVDLRTGELLAVLGPNGAGKSTAIALWLGLIEADTGQVTLLGGSPQDVERRRGLGVMMQDVELPKELEVRELIALAASYYEQPMSVAEALRRAGIEHLAGRRYGKLSGGQKRQAQFAVAICGRPRVLFLDEPTVGLDVQAREALWTSVRQLLADGCSIVLTTHYLEEAEALADRIVVVTKGRVIATGSVDDMRSLVTRRQISCESALSPQDISGWPGVVDVQRHDDKLQITATDAEGVVRRLLAADPDLRRLEVRQAGLNEAFNELTREAA